MREKKPYMVITFPTTAMAMAMERFCGENAIPGRHIPVPGEIAAGCGIAWRMQTKEYEIYKDKILSSGIVMEQRKELWLY